MHTHSVQLLCASGGAPAAVPLLPRPPRIATAHGSFPIGLISNWARV